VLQLVIKFEKGYYPFRIVVLYNTLKEFGIPMKPVRPIKLYLNETYSRYRLGKYCLTCFLLRNFEARKFVIAIVFQVCIRVGL